MDQANSGRELDRNLAQPLYVQLARRLRTDITSGKFDLGERLPSEEQLMETFGVSRPTVRQALNTLRAEGLIRIERGVGTFVSKSPERPQRQVRLRSSPFELSLPQRSVSPDMADREAIAELTEELKSLLSLARIDEESMSMAKSILEAMVEDLRKKTRLDRAPSG